VRRRDPVPEGPTPPERLCRFVFEEWVTLPAEPTDDYVESWRCQMGTKGTLADDWARWRYLTARLAHGRARRAWCHEHRAPFSALRRPS